MGERDAGGRRRLAAEGTPDTVRVASAPQPTRGRRRATVAAGRRRLRERRLRHVPRPRRRRLRCGTVGPNLDAAKPPAALVVERVTNGKGAMPSFEGQLTRRGDRGRRRLRLVSRRQLVGGKAPHGPLGRRGRDLNPRHSFHHVHDFQSRSLGHSDTSPRPPSVAVTYAFFWKEEAGGGTLVPLPMEGERIEARRASTLHGFQISTRSSPRTWCDWQ